MFSRLDWRQSEVKAGQVKISRDGLQKYNKNFFDTRMVFSPFLLVMALVGGLGAQQGLEASVTWLVSDNGMDLTFQTDGGSLDLGDVTEAVVVDPRDFQPHSYVSGTGSSGFYMMSQDFLVLPGVGVPSDFLMFLRHNVSANFDGAGPTFGFGGPSLILGAEFGDFDDLGRVNSVSSSITPESTFRIPGYTVSSLFGSTLDSGPVLLWTHQVTGDTILLSRAIPEPSVVLCSLTGFFLFGLRRRS